VLDGVPHLQRISGTDSLIGFNPQLHGLSDGLSDSESPLDGLRLEAAVEYGVESFDGDVLLHGF